MGFILDGLDTEAYDRNYSDRELVARVLRYFLPFRRKMIVVASALALDSMAGTAGPILLSKGIDILAGDPSSTALVFLAGGILLLGAAAVTLTGASYLSKLEQPGMLIALLNEGLVIGSWVFSWELISLSAFQRFVLKRELKKWERMAGAELKFVYGE